MEENCQSPILEAEIVGIRFGLATHKDICTASISDCPISHSTQLTNPFLGLPLEFGKCESCGTSEPGKCEGHFGYIELPVPIYHPSHVSELKRMLSLLCLKCLKLKNSKLQTKNVGVAERMFACCEEAAQVSVREVQKAEGVSFLELRLPARAKPRWSFLERYGFRYGDENARPLLPFEVLEMLKRIPEETRKKLARKGYFPQDGYVLQYLPVPPNCLSVPDISDGTHMLSSDLSTAMLKKVLKQVEIIKGSRSGHPNFESHEVEAIDLQLAVDQYLQVRGTVKTARDAEARFGVTKEAGDSTTKAWLEKMRTLFIRKGSGFSSRSVITGDAYKQVNEIGIPHEIAQRITFEERVSVHNVKSLQQMVDNKLCLTYKDGSSTFSLREGSKGHTFLRLGQIVHRRIMDGDMVFINRPPTTHKHSLQALRVYIHDDHTVKINPLICGPLSADFDGDCIHLFYPQSVTAKAEVLELFSVEKQLLSSHSGNLLLQLTTDSLLSLKSLFNEYFLEQARAQELAMFVSSSSPVSVLVKENGRSSTVLEILQICLPSDFDCFGERYCIKKSEILELDLSMDVQLTMNEVLASIFFEKGANEVLQFFNSLQPLLMEYLFSCGFSFGLNDFYMPKAVLKRMQENCDVISPLLGNLRSTHNELVEMQVENHMRKMKGPVADFISTSSTLGLLVDSRSDSAVSKVVQQIGFLGLQVADRGKFYTKTLVEDMASHFECNYPPCLDYPSAKFGLVRSCFFYGLDPYEEMLHSISAREVIVRSSRGLSEPGTLFKNLMAILRDVVVCYDGTIRNVCSNSIIQFEYGLKVGKEAKSLSPAGEPVGVLAATAMSNPAYKAVLDSTPSSNSSWELMKEILLCKVNFKNDLSDRRVILYLNDCGCGRKYCVEKAAYMVKNHLAKVSLKNIAESFFIEYRGQETTSEGCESFVGLCGHVHLNKMKLQELNISMQKVLQKCQEALNTFAKKKKVGFIFKRTVLSISECCFFQQPCSEGMSGLPCLMFFFQDNGENPLERISDVLADHIFPVLSEATVKGDHRVSSANITWVSPETTTWIRNPSRTQNVELAVDVVLEKSAVKQTGDAWRIVLDCCLPILHLIDTARSIPYAIKQVQELLGVSCAFDQAVQRLSTSVTMVAKGVLKEHLILLANSMTCTGNLVGFNPGGYKALSRAFDVQVPFTEATLFTPKKCFERAAEKCHLDTLSSVVASCSWGKRVAVGTGSRFDILWGTKEASLNQEGSIDVYSFLNMVRSSGVGDESVTACLGAEVDDLMMDEIDDWNLSPERDSEFGKPVFEDGAEIQNHVDNQAAEANWDKPSSNGFNASRSWDADKTVGSGGENSWSGWQRKTTETENVVSAKVPDKSGRSCDWDTADTWTESQLDSWSGWGNKKIETESVVSTKAPDESGRSGDWDTTDTWETSANKRMENQQDSWSGWGTKKIETENVVSTKVPDKSADTWQTSANKRTENQQDSWSGLGTKKIETENVVSTKVPDKSADTWKTSANKRMENQQDSWSGWGTKNIETENVGSTKVPDKSADTWQTSAKRMENQQDSWSGWGTKNIETENVVSTKLPDKSADTWQTSANKRTENQQDSWSGWGTKNIETHENTTTKAQEEPGRSSNWDAHDAQERNTEDDGWDNPGKSRSVWEAETMDKQDNVSAGAWGQSAVSNDWNASASSGWNASASKNVGTGVEKPSSSFQWSTTEMHDVGSTKVREESDWGSGQDTADVLQTRSTKNIKQKKDSWSSWDTNSKSAAPGDWKNKRKFPAKPPRIPVDDSMFTLTRQRLDMFTSDEQNILSEVEPLMRSIRRIMHNSGYNDGDPLSTDDQSYVLDNVFNYHPDKAVKMGAGIDHVTVSKHGSFQDSRCFYIVSTDGQRQDFSYRKCLENFVKEKYPDLVEEFNAKYFTKPRASRPRNAAPEGARDGKQQESPALEGAKEGANRPRNPAPEGAWDGNRQQSPALEGAEDGANWPHNPGPEGAWDGNWQQSRAPEGAEDGGGTWNVS